MIFCTVLNTRQKMQKTVLTEGPCKAELVMLFWHQISTLFLKLHEISNNRFAQWVFNWWNIQLRETIHIYIHNFRNTTRNAKNHIGISHSVKEYHWHTKARLCRLIFNQKTYLLPNPHETLYNVCLKKINKRELVYKHTTQLVIHSYSAKSFTATRITCSWELKQRIINVMTISLSGYNKVNYPEVLALDDKGAARSSQRKFFHCSNVMM